MNWSGSFKHQINKSFVLQHDQTDCGVACLLSTIRFFGGNSSFDELRRLSGTNRFGTSLLGLFEAAQNQGLEAEAGEADLSFLRGVDNPVILHFHLKNNLQHYVVYFGEVNNKPIIGDPGKGVVLMEWAELLEYWKSRACLSLKPGKDFVQENTIKKQKRKWLDELINSDKQILITAFGLGVLLSIFGMSQSVFNQILLDKILPQGQMNKILVAIVLLGLVLFSNTVFRMGRQYILARQGKEFNLRAIKSYLEKLFQLPKSFFDNRKTGDLVSRLNDSSKIQYFVTQVFGNLIIDILIILVAVVFQFFYLKVVGLISLLFIVTFIVIFYLFIPAIKQLQRKSMEEYAHSESTYINSLQGIETIKSRSLLSAFLNRNMIAFENFQQTRYKLAIKSTSLGFWIETSGIFYLLAVLSICISFYVKGNFTIGKIIALLGITSIIIPALSRTILSSISYQDFLIAFDRLFEYDLSKKEIIKGNLEIEKFDHLKVIKLSYRFPGQLNLLKEITFEIKKGEILAVLGDNGCGKSTLLQIIQKFLVPKSGEIIVNGININDIANNSWRKNIGVLPQNIPIFNDSIFFNITGEAPTKENFESLKQFSKEYGFDSFFSSFPDNVFCMIGEENLRLSGGQKQMLGLARALYHNPDLLLLDEPTAAMDLESEKFTIELLKKLSNKKAILVISHQFHLMKNFADRIYLIENGNIVAKGTHNELI
ncbi:MAG: peptidase domain-containing ABC transporter, partial [Bacteroidales bacterium]|nr:peptidase domain-containing ABC transporter [Bacteroidales bacterium]